MNFSRRYSGRVVRITLGMVLLVKMMSCVAYIPSNHPQEKTGFTIQLDNIQILPNSKISNVWDPPAPSIQDQASSNDTPRRRVTKPTWGVDKEHPEEYWFDTRIHTLGNHGFWGAVHAAVCPLATKVIDVASYQGIDVRQQLAQELSTMVHKQQARVLDLCCGVGISTRALQNAFPDASAVVGMDTSKEMVAMATFLTEHMKLVQPLVTNKMLQISELYQQLLRIADKTKLPTVRFLQGNAESTGLPNQSFDLVTVMWAFHEAPMEGRAKIIQEARRLLSPGGVLAVIDIAAEYVPSESMLKGEPYVQEYQQNIHEQLQRIQGFENSEYRNVIPNHLGMWTLTRSLSAA